MNATEFNEILANRQRQMQDTLDSKAAEYASDEDRLHNFKRAADVRHTSPEDACVGFMTKAWVWMLDLVDSTTSTDRKKLYIAEAQIDEKFGDLINYLVLLEALFRERFGLLPPDPAPRTTDKERS